MREKFAQSASNRLSMINDSIWNDGNKNQMRAKQSVKIVNPIISTRLILHIFPPFSSRLNTGRENRISLERINSLTIDHGRYLFRTYRCTDYSDNPGSMTRSSFFSWHPASVAPSTPWCRNSWSSQPWRVACRDRLWTPGSRCPPVSSRALKKVVHDDQFSPILFFETIPRVKQDELFRPVSGIFLIEIEIHGISEKNRADITPFTPFDSTSVARLRVYLAGLPLGIINRQPSGILTI